MTNNGTAVLEQPEQIVSSKPTPGPYQVKDLDKEPVVVGEGQPDEFHAFTPEVWAGDVYICELKSYIHTDAKAASRGFTYASADECAANAHLLATSWDLLKAAETALEVLGKNPFLQEEWDAVQALKAAIAKAYGQGAES